MSIPEYLLKSNKELKREFQELQKFDRIKYQQEIEIESKLLKGNYRNENRYSDIIPYTNTRVKLEDGGYINANYINPSNDILNKYIATQGPLKNTIFKFWQLIMEELYIKDNDNIDIIMLTELEEDNREKCYNYIKTIDNDLINCGIKLFNKKFIKSNLKILNNNGIELREFNDFENGKKIRHFWVRKWPDFGIPDKDKDNNLYLIKYLHNINMNNNKNIKIVHCSAGVGRSGTFILLDWYYNKIYLKGLKQDIFESVMNMRKCRVMMVQRFEQYEYLYMVIKELYE